MDYLADRPDHVRFDCELLVRLSQYFANVGDLHSFKPMEVELRDIRKMVADVAAIHEILERISATR